MKQAAIFAVFAVASSMAAAAPSALEEEVVYLARALSPPAPTSNGKGSYFLGAQAKGKLLEVRLRFESESGDWRSVWQSKVCSDLSTRRILAMGGTVAINAQGSHNNPFGVLTISPPNCGKLGMPITAADAPPRNPWAPAPSAPAPEGAGVAR
jgi:hypothetical protein